MAEVVSLSAVVVVSADAGATADVVETLTKAGHAVHVASDGATGVALVRELNPLVTIVHADLPDIDGSEVARRIREFGSTYIVMFSEDVDEIDVILALSAGCDDYLPLPLRPRELRARIGAMLRRPRTVASDASAPSPVSPASVGGWSAAAPAARTVAAPRAARAGIAGTVLSHNGVEVALRTRTVLVDGAAVALTRSELELLAFLLSTPGRVIAKDELVRALWTGTGTEAAEVTEADRRTVEVHVANLRRKLGETREHPRVVETVRGVGYRLTPVTTN